MSTLNHYYPMYFFFPTQRLVQESVFNNVINSCISNMHLQCTVQIMYSECIYTSIYIYINELSVNWILGAVHSARLRLLHWHIFICHDSVEWSVCTYGGVSWNRCMACQTTFAPHVTSSYWAWSEGWWEKHWGYRSFWHQSLQCSFSR